MDNRLVDTRGGAGDCQGPEAIVADDVLKLPPLVHAGRLSDHVYDALRSRILSGGVEPGHRLVETEIARHLKVSQAPVRDAFARLAHEGLIVSMPRRGSFVASVNQQETRRAYELRGVIEPYAAEEFCRHAGEAAVDAVAALAYSMTAAAERDDLVGLIEADVAFHAAVYAGSAHPLLPRIWPMVENTMRAFTIITNRLYYSSLDEVAATHLPLLEALQDRDAGRATRLFAEHVGNVWERIEDEGSGPEEREPGRT
jgi:DNA-binding GntR family transcriptional regulator